MLEVAQAIEVAMCTNYWTSTRGGRTSSRAQSVKLWSWPR